MNSYEIKEKKNFILIEEYEYLNETDTGDGSRFNNNTVLSYIDDENTANMIAGAINNIDKGEGCKYGSICRMTIKRVNIVGNEINHLSDGYQNIMNLFYF